MSRSSSARARRNQQILFLILSVLVVASMALSLFTLTPEPVQPTALPLSPTPPLEWAATLTPQATPTPITQ
mgnify:CR=1 FL=1